MCFQSAQNYDASSQLEIDHNTLIGMKNSVSKKLYTVNWFLSSCIYKLLTKKKERKAYTQDIFLQAYECVKCLFIF